MSGSIVAAYGPSPTGSTTAVTMDFSAGGFVAAPWQDGDILVIAVCSNDVVANAVMRYSMAAEGWDEQVDKSINSARRQSIALYTKEITDAGSEPTSAVVTASRADNHYRACWLLRGVDYADLVVYDEDIFNTSDPVYATGAITDDVFVGMAQGWIQDNTQPIAPELTVLTNSVPNVYGWAGHTVVTTLSPLTVTNTGTENDTDDWQAVGVILPAPLAEEEPVSATPAAGGDGGPGSYGRGDYAQAAPMLRWGDEKKWRLHRRSQG